MNRFEIKQCKGSYCQREKVEIASAIDWFICAVERYDHQRGNQEQQLSKLIFSGSIEKESNACKIDERQVIEICVMTASVKIKSDVKETNADYQEAEVAGQHRSLKNAGRCDKMVFA